MVLQYDIVIVGGGGAGLRAAIAIGESHPKLKIALVSKVYPMRSHTVAAEGGAAAVIKNNDLKRRGQLWNKFFPHSQMVCKTTNQYKWITPSVALIVKLNFINNDIWHTTFLSCS